MSDFASACEDLTRQFGRDTVLSLATVVGDQVSVRTVNAYYRDGHMYVVTNTSTRKMQDVAMNAHVAMCKDLFSAHGLGENIGSPRENRALADELSAAFSSWYGRHVDEDDPGTCILRIRLTDAVVFTDDTKYVVDFTGKTAISRPFKNDIIT